MVAADSPSSTTVRHFSLIFFSLFVILAAVSAKGNGGSDESRHPDSSDDEANFRVRVGPEEFSVLLEDGDYGNLDKERLNQTVNNLYAHVFEVEIATHSYDSRRYIFNGQVIETNRYLRVLSEGDYGPNFASDRPETILYNDIIEKDGVYHLVLSQGFVEAFIEASKYAEVTDELNEYIERLNRIRLEELESLTEAQIDSIQYVDSRLINDPSSLEKKRNYLRQFTLDVYFLASNVFWIGESIELGPYLTGILGESVTFGEAIYYTTEDRFGYGWSGEEGIHEIPPPSTFDPLLHAQPDSGRFIWVPDGTWGFIYDKQQWKIGVIRPGT